ncbi:MAG: (d)CMP kinase [Oscillospiraceae bacterium]|nr:(d)CMP kinase [Oscillospiraceae bacterium]MBQ8979448.1 (d)CMP kinase [Oscillospiraceae bacterium]
MQIAIDGPAGAGKSTIARAAAHKCGMIYVDTGAVYRAVAYALRQLGTDIHDEAAVRAALSGIKPGLAFSDGEQRVYVNGEDVTDFIRTPENSLATSCISAYPSVRAFLLETQRKIARENDVIMDGRDIGTVVLPDADVKIFLTASPECRARRRYAELAAKGEDITYEQTLAEMIQRDRDDTERAASPLRKADDAVLLDTSDMDLEQSVRAVEALISGGRK